MTNPQSIQKAYRVYEKHEDFDDGMGIVFARSAAEARSHAWCGTIDREVEIVADAYIDLRAQREPWADRYADADHIPMIAYLAHGWVWMCRDCDAFVGLDDMGGITADDDVLCERHASKEGQAPAPSRTDCRI